MAQGTVKSLVSTLNSKLTTNIIDISNPSGIEHVKVLKNGNVCAMQLTGALSLPNGSTTICTLPEGYRPKTGVYQDIIVPKTNTDFSALRLVRISVGTGGVCIFYNYGTQFSVTNFQLPNIVFLT